MRRLPGLAFFAIPLLCAGCASTRPKFDAVQAQQASLREEILRVEKSAKKTESRLEELEKRITYLEGNLTGNLADLQRSVDGLSERVEKRETETSKKLDSFSAGLDERFQSIASKNKELLGAIEEARKASYTTGYEHFVERGETLGAVARSYGVPVKVIMEANDITDPDSLTVGQKLFIPK